MSTTKDDSWKDNPPIAKEHTGWRGYRFLMSDAAEAMAHKVDAVFMCSDDNQAIAKCTEASIHFAVFLRAPVTFSLERETLGKVMDQIKYHKHMYPGLYQTLLR